jgi:hypothetical protein
MTGIFHAEMGIEKVEGVGFKFTGLLEQVGPFPDDPAESYQAVAEAFADAFSRAVTRDPVRAAQAITYADVRESS